MFENKKIAVFGLTPAAEKIALQLKAEVDKKNKANHLDLYLSARLKNKDHFSFGSLRAKTAEIFSDYQGLVFIMALGITVRIIAPLIESKENDPAVVTIDDRAQNVISTLSGHLGGANQLTEELAELLKARPVITTATDLNNKLAVDLLAERLNCKIRPFSRLKKANSALLFGGNLHIFSEYQIELKKTENLKLFPLSRLAELQSRDNFEVIISNNKLNLKENQLQLIPRNLVLGIGCRKNTSFLALEEALNKFLYDFNLCRESIKKTATIDLKKEEKGIRELAAKNNWPLIIIEREEIKAVEAELEIKKSDFVRKITGVSAAAAPAAILASASGKLLIDKQKYEGITFAVFEEEIKDE